MLVLVCPSQKRENCEESADKNVIQNGSWEKPVLKNRILTEMSKIESKKFYLRGFANDSRHDQHSREDLSWHKTFQWIHV